jgi:proteasome lid subunit RPN8/RPN11
VTAVPVTGARRERLAVPPAIREALERHAAEVAPNEACGVLVFRDGEALRYEPGRNRAASPYRFDLDIDPEVWFLEDDGYELAVFHSHPADSAQPSRTDLANIGLWKGRPYVILASSTGELAGWRIQDGRAEALLLTG